jgi:sulfotransferase
MKKTIHCVSGLPRAGSTLLCSILAQNPRFQVTPTSGIIEIVLSVRNHWNKILEFQAAPNEAAKLRVMRAALEAFFDEPNNDRPVVFDKCRGWLAALESLEAILGRKAKVIVLVRDVRDVLASFEQLWRIDSSTWELPQEHANYYKWQTIEGRCEVWMSANQPVGLAYNRIQDALARGFADRMHFVEFEELTRHPREVMQGIYEFLEEPSFEHDFDHIEQVTHEDDSRIGIPGLHEIRPKLEPVVPLWPKYLGNVADKYTRLNYLWRSVKQSPAAVKTSSPVSPALEVSAPEPAVSSV